MLTVRLTNELKHKLETFAKDEQQPKSQIVKDALLFYFENNQMAKKQTPYTLSKELFGRYGSNDGSLSTTYKEKLKEKLHAKNAH